MNLNFNKDYSGYIVGKLPLNYPRSSRTCNFILQKKYRQTQFQNFMIKIWACVLKIFSTTTTSPFALCSYKINLKQKRGLSCSVSLGTETE